MAASEAVAWDRTYSGDVVTGVSCDFFLGALERDSLLRWELEVESGPPVTVNILYGTDTFSNLAESWTVAAHDSATYYVETSGYNWCFNLVSSTRSSVTFSYVTERSSENASYVWVIGVLLGVLILAGVLAAVWRRRRSTQRFPISSPGGTVQSTPARPVPPPAPPISSTVGCPKCGAAEPRSATFCRQCGTRLQ